MENSNIRDHGSYLLPILAYCASSIVMTVTNKFVLSQYHFNLNFLLLAAQSLTCVLLLRYFAYLRLITHRSFSSSDARKWFPVSMGLVLMIFTGSKALEYMSIPLFTIFKNLTIILIAYGELLILKGPKLTRIILTSFCLMIISSVVAGWSDITSGKILKSAGEEVGIFRSYFWMTLNCATSAAFALMMRSKIKDIGFRDFDTVFYNNLLSVPVLLVCSLLLEVPKGYALLQKYGFLEGYSGDEGVHAMSEWYAMWFAIITSSIASFGISYCSSWCVRMTSSTTYSMVGALNKLPIAVFGMIIFDDHVSYGSIIGVATAFFAGLLYSYGKSFKASPPATLLPSYSEESLNRMALDKPIDEKIALSRRSIDGTTSFRDSAHNGGNIPYQVSRPEKEARPQFTYERRSERTGRTQKDAKPAVNGRKDDHRD